MDLLGRLPAETLGEIVKIYLENEGNITHITQICRRIRQIVFGMTTIWGNLRLLSVNDPVGYAYRYEFVKFLYFRYPVRY
jgi:hypothetical protein